MKKSYLIIVLLFISVCSFSQVRSKFSDASISKTLKKPGKADMFKMFTLKDNSFLSVRRRGDDIIIQKFDDQLNETGIKFVDFRHKHGAGKVYFENVIQIGEYVYIITKQKNKNRNEFYFYAQPLDISTLSLENRFIKLVTFDFMRGDLWEDLYFYYSDDKSKLAIAHHSIGKTLKEKFFNVKVFDSSLELLWEHRYDDYEIIYPLAGSRLQVTNKGEVYFFIKIQKNKRDKVKGKPESYYDFLFTTEGGEDVQKYRIDLHDNFISEIRAIKTKEYEIAIVGFYSKIGSSFARGTFTIKIDYDDESADELVYNNFGIDFITKYLSERKEKKAKKKHRAGKDVELEDYFIDHLLLKDDGGIIAVSEQYYVIKHVTRSSSGSTRTTYHYYYGNIMVLNFNDDLELDWIKTVPKHQHTTNDKGFFSSYTCSLKDDDLYLAYNDSKLNQRITDPRKFRTMTKNGRGKDVALFLVKVSEEGNIEKETICSVLNLKMYIRIKISKTFPNDDLLIFTRTKGVYRFVKLSF